jgi:hypothetical protein
MTGETLFMEQWRYATHEKQFRLLIRRYGCGSDGEQQSEW